jgi:hypothetical protein
MANIEPLAATRSSDGGIWRDPDGMDRSWLDVDLTTDSDGTRIGSAPTAQIVDDDPGHPRVVYTNDSPMPWGWRVSSYFLTKAVSAGIAISAATALVFGAALESMWMRLTAPLAGGLLLLLTGVLLVWDLKRPDRFYYLLTKGNPSSWLVRGSWVLTAQAITFGVWFLAALLGLDGIARFAIWSAALIGLATAGYTAFLFSQAKGRTLWNSPILVWHMIASAFLVGGGASLNASLVSVTDHTTGSVALLATRHLAAGTAAFTWTMLIGAVGLAVTAGLESMAKHGPDVALAYHHMTRGAFANRYRLGLLLSIVIPVVAGIAVLGGAGVAFGAAGGISAMVGVLLVDDAFVQAGQSVPLT